MFLPGVKLTISQHWFRLWFDADVFSEALDNQFVEMRHLTLTPMSLKYIQNLCDLCCISECWALSIRYKYTSSNICGRNWWCENVGLEDETRKCYKDQRGTVVFVTMQNESRGTDDWHGKGRPSRHHADFRIKVKPYTCYNMQIVLKTLAAFNHDRVNADIIADLCFILTKIIFWTLYFNNFPSKVIMKFFYTLASDNAMNLVRWLTSDTLLDDTEKCIWSTFSEKLSVDNRSKRILIIGELPSVRQQILRHGSNIPFNIYIYFQSSAYSYLAKQYGIHFVIFTLNDWHLLSHWNIIGERQKLTRPCNETFITKPHKFISIGKLPNVTTVLTVVKHTAKYCKSKSICTPAHVWGTIGFVLTHAAIVTSTVEKWPVRKLRSKSLQMSASMWVEK